MTTNTPHKAELDNWLQRFNAIDPHHIDLGLERLQQILVQHPLQLFQCPVVTVTGTNGKGSICALLEGFALAQGLRVGVYTSPHLFRFNERIRLQGQPVNDATLMRALQVIDTIKGDVPLTYFELTTLTALHCFQHCDLDILILEIGLGGRLDAVNVVDPDISVISNIALDHCQWLGPTRDDIAREKAGILRAGRTFVCGDRDPPPCLRDIAKGLDCKSYFLGHEFTAHLSDKHWYCQSHHKLAKNLPLPPLGIDNAAVALQTWSLLQEQHPNWDHDVTPVIGKTYLPGRYQTIIVNAVPIIFDVAHNPASAAFLCERLKSSPCQGRTLAVVAMLADKDIPATLTNCLSHVDTWYLAPLQVTRAASLDRLRAALPDSAQIHTSHHLKQALHAAQLAANPCDRIIVFGSFYTVSELLPEVAHDND